jgi:hypothetical protein
VLVLWGCSSHKHKKEKQKIPVHARNLKHLTVYSTIKKADTLRLRKVQIFGKYYSTRAGGTMPIVVDDSNRVFVPNAAKFTIGVYNSKGKLVDKIGGKGRGPGEFHEIQSLQISGNHLYVYDGRLKQYQVFLLWPLSYSTTIQTIPKNLKRFKNLRYINHHPLYVINDSTFLYKFKNLGNLFKGLKLKMGIQSAYNGINYYIMDRSRKIKPDTILHQKGRKIISTHVHGAGVIVWFPFTRKPLIALSENHRLYSARSQTFLIKVYNLKGNYLRAFYYPYKRAPLTRGRIDSISGGNNDIQQARRKVISKTKLPATWPALQAMFFDDQNRLWVATIVKNQRVYQWWVLNNQGKLLVRFQWSRNRPIKAIRNGYLYAAKSNNKRGTYKILKYKIQIH